MGKPNVLDASAVLAWLQQEDGADIVDPLLEGALVSVANWAEILQKVQNVGVDPDATALSLKALGVEVAPLIEEDCAVIAKWWFADSALALGDRCCLALAERVGGQAVTAEQRWGDLRDVDVLLIR